MSLPASRNTTYGKKSQIKSADLNDGQDCIVLLTGPHRLPLAALSAPALYGSFSTFGAYWKAPSSVGAGVRHTLPIPIPEGAVIRSLTTTLRAAGAGNIEVDLLVSDGELLVSAGATWEGSFAATLNVLEDHVLDGDDFTIPAGEMAFVRFTAGNNDDRFYKVVVAYSLLADDVLGP